MTVDYKTVRYFPLLVRVSLDSRSDSSQQFLLLDGREGEYRKKKSTEKGSSLSQLCRMATLSTGGGGGWMLLIPLPPPSLQP